MTARRVRRAARWCLIGVCLVGSCRARTAGGQTQTVLPPPLSLHGTVKDQTELPLVGVTVELIAGGEVVASTVTDVAGEFSFDPVPAGDTIVASLDGFETARVPRADAERLTLKIAHATESTTVVAQALTPESPTTALLGSTLTAATVSRLPSTRLKARESLPLLPSVVRGADGLMHVGGARAYDTPLLLDGFRVTDPATGISSLNLPFEAVRGVEVLRDPMATSYGSLIGGLVKMESLRGTDHLTGGVQGFVPRPRLSSPGFGRIEGFFPRAYVAGSNDGGGVRYVAAAEYDFERIAVPDVTTWSGPYLTEQSAVVFSRVDAEVSAHNTMTVEGFVFPSSTEYFGLSTRRELDATVNLTSNDLFGGVTDRYVSSGGALLTVQLGIVSRDAESAPVGSGLSHLSPDRWSGNWFSRVRRSATRYIAAAMWERAVALRGRAHELAVSGELTGRQLSGTVEEQPLAVTDGIGRTVRTIEFGPAAAFAARDWPAGLSVRDVWHATDRLQLEGGARVDHTRRSGGVPSGRLGARYALDAQSKTILKAGFGRFVGNLPLAAPAFGGYPVRIDRSFDPESGAMVQETFLRPVVGRMRLPRALAAVVGMERQLVPGLDMQALVTWRRSSNVATVRVPGTSGNLVVESTGAARYRELQLSIRRKWPGDQQLFVSYVRSSAIGELNDFATLFQSMDTPLLQPGGMARAPSDAPHRVLMWGTVNLPARVVVSPVAEWHSGFPYSDLNNRYMYAGAPNAQSFPAFMSVDVVTYKTFTVKGRSADIGGQLFNATNHFNPRDVYPVVGSLHAGQFTNSVGPLLRGFLLFKW
jgi:hypothetical protein